MYILFDPYNLTKITVHEMLPTEGNLEIIYDSDYLINESNYTKTGVIAPGTTGYFNLAIDATDVDVDFTYTIEFESLNSLEDIKVTSYEINNDGITHNVTDTVTGDIVHNTATTNIKCNFEWYDGADNVMDNHDDTETAKNSTTADIKVIINFIQKQ